MESADDTNSGNIDYTSLKSGNTFKTTLSQQDADNTEVLNISGKYNSVIIVKNLSMDNIEFNRLNPGFDMVMSSGEPFDLRLSSDKMDLFVANKYPILNECVHVLLNNVNTETKTVYPDQKKIKKKK